MIAGTIPALCAERAVDLHQRALRLPHHVPPLQTLQRSQPVQPGKSMKLVTCPSFQDDLKYFRTISW